MPSEFTVDITLDLSIPDLSDASIPLTQIAEKIKSESQKRIRQQINIDGTRYRGLSRKTIQDKIREGSAYPLRALFRKGVMYRAIHVYKAGKNEVHVGVIPRGKPSRDLVGIIHQEQGTPSKSGRIQRTFLGITKKTEKWANERMERWIKGQLEKPPKEKIYLKIG